MRVSLCLCCCAYRFFPVAPTQRLCLVVFLAGGGTGEGGREGGGSGKKIENTTKWESWCGCVCLFCALKYVFLPLPSKWTPSVFRPLIKEKSQARSAAATLLVLLRLRASSSPAEVDCVSTLLILHCSAGR
eukprot:Hpha_TRINITY_DN15557_c3_g3::TRINITY_DN15557_c3_g3_i3::g.104742::m.104742